MARPIEGMRSAEKSMCQNSVLNKRICGVDTIHPCESNLSAPKCKRMGNTMCQDYTMVWEARSLRQAIYYKVHDKTPE